jgi:hypothetical protein
MRSVVLSFVAACAVASAGLAAAQAPDVFDPSYEPPRLASGKPDLQGLWSNALVTPLERPADLADKEFLTEEEAREYQANRVAAVNRDRRPDDPEADLLLAYNDFWWDSGTSGVRTLRTSLIVDPPNGRIPPLTPEAQERQAARGAAGAPARVGGRADSYTDRTLLERCITRASAGAPLPTLYNNNIRITQAPDAVAIVNEMVHETRLVPLDGSPFGNVRSYNGESRGRWEGDTLVVETRNFDGKAPYRGAGSNLVLTERYTRVGPDKIDFRITFQDDTQWTQPWTAAYSMRTGEGELYEYACHEGNYGLRNILENARDEERKAAEAAR